MEPESVITHIKDVVAYVKEHRPEEGEELEREYLAVVERLVELDGRITKAALKKLEFPILSTNGVAPKYKPRYENRHRDPSSRLLRGEISSEEAEQIAREVVGDWNNYVSVYGRPRGRQVSEVMEAKILLGMAGGHVERCSVCNSFLRQDGGCTRCENEGRTE